MNQVMVDIDLDTMDRDGICLAQNLTANTALLLNGPLGASLDYARIIGVYSSANLSLIAFTIVGTNSMGETISETIATGPNNSTVVSTKLYKTITSIKPDTTDGVNSVEVGTVATTLSAESIVVQIDENLSVAPTIMVDVTGTVNFTVQECFMNTYNNSFSSLVFLPISALSSKTADVAAQCTPHASALKIQINSYSAGAELQVYINPGYRNH